MRAAGVALPCLLVVSSLATAAVQFPALTGRVVDQAGILSSDTERDLTQLLESFERKSGIQLVVATVTDLGGEDLETYSVDLARHWQIGQKGKDNGVMLLIAPTERAIRIEVGYGHEGDLTDARASEIINQRMVPAFRTGDYNGGVRAGVNAIIEVIGGDYQPVAPSKPHARQSIPLGVFWFLMILFLLGGIGGGRRRGLRSVARAAAWGIMLGGMNGRRGGYGGDFGGGFGGGSFGGGGFKGGGGSFGGGGASGHW